MTSARTDRSGGSESGHAECILLMPNGTPRYPWQTRAFPILSEKNCSNENATEEGLITPYHRPVTSIISMLGHLGGIGVFILATLDSSVLPTLGGVDALTIVLASLHPERWPYYATCSTAGSICGASVAYRLSRLGILHRRIEGAVFDRVTGILASFWKPFSVARRIPSATISDFRLCSRRWRDALSFQFVCAVFRCGTSVPLCSTGLPRICFRQAVRDKYVVGAHAGACSGFWRCAGVHRVAGVACLQEIRTAYAFRFVALFTSTPAASNFEMYFVTIFALYFSRNFSRPQISQPWHRPRDRRRLLSTPAQLSVASTSATLPTLAAI